MMLSRSFLRALVGAAPLLAVVCLAVDGSVAQTPAPGAGQTPAGDSAQPPPAAAPAPAAPAPAPPFPALPSLLADYRGMHAGSSYDASGKELRVGHLRMLFTSGTLTALVTASGREAGFVFDGAGRYDYTTVDPADLQTIAKNLLKFENTSSYKDGTLGEEMKGCILIATQPILPDILGPDAKPSGSGGEIANARLASFLADTDEADFGIDHPGALAGLAAAPARVLYTEISGKSVSPGYLYDPLSRREEQLWLFRTIQGDRFYNVVSHQLLDGGWRESPVLLTRLDYSMDSTDNRDADLKVSETLSFPGRIGRVLRFIFINNADTGATNWKSSKYAVNIRSVKTTDGRELPFSHRYHELLVELPEAPAAGSSATLVFDVALHSIDTRGDEFYIVFPGSGYPDPAWRNSIRATSHWKVRMKKPYKAFTGGNVISRSEDGNTLFLESDVDIPNDIPAVIAGKFDSKEYERNGLKVRVNIYGTGGGRAFDSYREVAYQLLGVYGNALVPYPRKELDIMELKRSYVSISMPGLVLVSADMALGDQVDYSTLRHRSDYDGQGRGSGLGASVVEARQGDRQMRTFMHELAHQWFGNLVHLEDFRRDRWIAESVAEYLSMLVYAAGAKNEKEKALKSSDMVKDWWVDTDMTRNSVSLASASDLRGEWTEGTEYIQLIYGRGPLVLRMLHSLLGEDKFFQVLHNVVTKYADKPISTEEFARETSAVAGQDMSWFFKQWIQEPGVPDLYVTQSVVHEGGKTYVAGHLRQQDRGRFKILVLPFVYTVQGKQAAKLVLMDKPDMDFKAELAPGASDVVLDPGKSLLVYYH